ncbi:baseplate J/gp47 family protein [Variovorax sp. KK3]|uniref:baseplate J/gp47 family protein n=1 Tax=Variovorax sp. KK3 TaxID=1855728 RepID=UPI00097BF9C1|nr:baseplate J/gp47 family protein [Variovorax sp. KK3]
MAATDLLAAFAAVPGTAQQERVDPRLAPAFAPIDDRDTARLLQSLHALAGLIRHHEQWPDTPAEVAAAGDWQPYLPSGGLDELRALVQQTDGRLPPHHGLLVAFLQLLARPQASLNEFTAKQLNYQMQRVLGFAPRAPRPDRAHLVFELKKGAGAVEIARPQMFSAGKDATKVEQLFAPVRPTVVSPARVARLASVLRDGQRLLFAPVADSADGLGTPLSPAAPHWPPFGRPGLPAAPVGFAVASPVLRLAEGERRVRLALRVSGLPPAADATALGAAFEAHFTGPVGWTGPLPMRATLSTDLLTLEVVLDAAQPAVVDHDPAIHLHAFPAALPVVQCLLRPKASLSFAMLEHVTVRSVQVSVDVKGMRTLVLENDDATLDPKKAFLPFGAQAAAGSRLHVGCPEALSKPVTALKIHLAWQGAPADLSAWYEGYARVASLANGVGATITWRDASGTERRSPDVTLIARRPGPTTLDVVAGAASSVQAYAPGWQLQSLVTSGSAVAANAALAMQLAKPIAGSPTLKAMQVGGAASVALGIAKVGIHAGFAAFPGASAAAPVAPAAARAGFVTVSLTEDLLHRDFMRDATAAATATPPKVLNPPYTPKVQEITLDYAARSDDSQLADPSLAAFTDTGVQFFQIDALGLAREHAWLDANRPWAPQGGIGLLPAHRAAAEFLIAIDGAQAGDSQSLLIQVADGTADPLAAAQGVQWSVLADNAWRTLGTGELVLDETRGLRASGLVGVVLPRETTTANTRLPPGPVWLRATTTGAADAACDVVGVHANAVEVAFADQGNDPSRLAAALPQGRIIKARTPLAQVKAIAQPYASFGGAMQEDDASLSRRASERLRHRNRAINRWDCERLVLQAFPSVHRAKCIPHASDDAWLAPGHLMLVVVPDLRGRPTASQLQPRVDLDTLTRIQAHLSARCGPQTRVHVRNPGYVPVQLDFKVRLRPGFGFNFYAPQIDRAIVQALSPWAFDSAAELGFGGRVVRSELLDFVEALPWVDFVTDFRLVRLVPSGEPRDEDEIVPDTPDAILVSALSHRIAEL